MSNKMDQLCIPSSTEVLGLVLVSSCSLNRCVQ